MTESIPLPFRKIIHVDMDCFYAAVEMRDNPELRNVPVAIGGQSDRRGVLSTCNYQARKYGVRSAMPTAHALKLCPSLVVVPGRMAVYKETSAQIHQIFRRYTELIEPLSLDEAYLDVTDAHQFQGSATLMAQAIRREIHEELGLTASAGVAPMKFIAKIASDLNKPNGQFVVRPDEVASFVERLALHKIPGVGKVTMQKLNALGLRCGADVQQLGRERMVELFGKFGLSLWERANGYDPRPVVVQRDPKSVGVERTLSQDIFQLTECRQVVTQLYPELERRLAPKLADKEISKLGVKIKFNDFRLTSVEHHHSQLDEAIFDRLLQQAMQRQPGKGIRLVGLYVGLRTRPEIQQLLLEV
uniref:DNA polymerase IV n=1 Tax=Thaumasiovibrio occultus TaxID=1891184 RepID=UPI000B34F7DF|nr:DNA polymerase IV [Thaumasiovibrio occultus]